ncbi:hypothetical protein V5E97_07645 [Singulisphaera sp. Ch08]|uniref:Uncharacterized protein n=1 Tax=Singulisphaera sp. Ch08 TaxID=3120278 RepID=A0AAU7CKS3_9BACT
MATSSSEEWSVIDSVDSALLRAIKGAIWFPFVCVPRQIHRSFPLVVKLFRIGFLLALWGTLVFGPTLLLFEVDEPVVVMTVLAWTVLALAGSIGGVLRLRRLVRAMAGSKKPENLKEAFV